MWLWLDPVRMMNAYHNKWTCKISEPYHFLWVSSYPIAKSMLVMISLDRLIAVLFPIRYYKFNRRYAAVIVGIPFGFWLAFGSLGNLLAFLVPGDDVFKGICLTSFSIPAIMGLITNYFNIVSGHLSTAIALLVVIVHRRSRMKVAAMVQSDNQLKKSIKQQQKLMKMIMITCIITFITFQVPATISLIWWSRMKDNHQLLAILSPILNGIIPNLNPIANVFIYSLRHGEIKLSVLKLICWWKQLH